MPESTVLIIEDDSTLLRGLKDNFQSNGYQVRTATDGQSGLNAALANPPDLILLDIMLPVMNGYEVCSSLRDNELTVPIIMLTAKGQEQDIIRGLNVGADDYVTKPFNIRELLARANAFLRRYQRNESPSQSYRFGDCDLDLSSHKLFRAGTEIPLTTKEFRLLEYFVTRPGRALARNDILDTVWGSSVIVTSRSVDRCIATLRAKVEPDARHPTYIKTIRDIGYRFEIPESESSVTQQDSITSAKESAVPIPPGTCLGRYEVESMLGQGGMAEVYKARDQRLDREVAVKVLKHTCAQKADLRRRFEREAKAVAALSHPNIRAIFDVANDQGLHFSVMEYLEGQTLRDRLSSSRMAWPEALDIAINIADGLSAAHEKGIVHRDVKPANVFLVPEGNVKILDFGLALVTTNPVTADTASAASTGTSPGSVLGTVNYMSPEQARGQETDARTDIFSLGVVLFEMLTGTLPFARKTIADTTSAILNEAPPQLESFGVSFPNGLNEVVMTCLRKNLSERCQSASDLRDALVALGDLVRERGDRI